MIVNFTNSAGLSGIDFEVERIKSIIKLVKGQLPLRKPKFAESFQSVFAWPIPKELECWLGVKHWPVEEFQFKQRKTKVIIDLPYYLSNSFIVKFLNSRDDNERLIVPYNNWETAQAMLSGLLFAGNSQDGNGLYIDCSADADSTYCSVYRWDMQLAKMSELAGATFSSFILDGACSYLENLDTPNTPSEKAAIQQLRKQQQEITVNFEVSPKREHLVLRRARRAYWLIALLAQKTIVPGEIIASSPKYSTWKKDAETLEYDSTNLHYWMLAHYFIGNEDECVFCIDVARESESLLSRELAKTVRRLLDDPKYASLGELPAEKLKEFKQELKVYLVPAHHSPDKREQILEEKGGIADLSPYALLKAVRARDKIKIKEFIDAGLDINEDYEFETAISVASQNKDFKIVEFLLDLDAEVTVSSLHWAVIQGNVKMLKALVTNTRNLKKAFNERYYFGQTLLHCSIKTDNRHVYDYLIKNGADPNITTDFKETPLMEAASKGHFEYIDSLIKNGAKPNTKDENKRTALHYAAENSVKSLIKLVKNKANLNVRDGANRTPLMVAAQTGNYKGAKELLKNGAKKNLKDQDGFNAVQIAEQEGFDQLAAYIKEYNFTPMI